MSTVAARRPPTRQRYGPGADLLGCVVVLDDGEQAILRCPCGATLTMDRSEVRDAQRRGFDVTCRGCAAGTKAETARQSEIARLAVVPRPGTATAVLLKAALRFPGEFTVAEITVAGWQVDPGRFGLPGFERQHPDSNKVKVELCQSKTRGRTFGRFVDKVGENRFRLNAAGLAAAKALVKKGVG